MSGPYQPPSPDKSSYHAMMLAPRVGGGYATPYQVGHHAYKYSSQKDPATEMKPLKPSRCFPLEEFDADDVTCLAVVQGGASLWTAERSGALAIRNPRTGAVHHRIERENPDAAITLLYPWGTGHIVAGAEDGGVEMYDHLMAVCVYRCVKHKSRVVAVAESAYAQQQWVFSICSEVVVRWSTQNEEFRPVMSTAALDVQMSSLAVHGTNVFVGDTSGCITLLEANEFQVLGRWTAHAACTVTALLHCGTFLYSGGSDGLLHVWQGVLGSQGPVLLHTHAALHDSAVRSIRVDAACNRIWSTDERKVMRWERTPDSVPPFTVYDCPTTVASPDCSLLDLSMFTSWKALRLWSLGSNGKNCSWFSAFNVAADEMKTVAAEMEILTRQETVESLKWRDMVNSVKQTDARRKVKLAAYQEQLTGLGMLQVFYQRWLAWLLRHREHKRGCHAAVLMGRLCNNEHRRQGWKRLQQQVELRERRQAGEKLAASIEPKSRLRLLGTYWDRWKCFFNIKTRTKRKHTLATVLLKNTEAGFLCNYYKMLLQYKKKAMARVKNQQLAVQLLFANSKDFLRYYYYKLWRWAEMMGLDRRKKRRAQLVGGLAGRSVAWRYYAALVAHADRCKRRTRDRHYMATVEPGNSMRPLLKRCYDTLKRHHMHRRASRTVDATEALNKQLADLQAEQLRLEFRDLHKREQDLTLEMRNLAKRKEELRESIKHRTFKIEHLRERLRCKQDVEKSIREQFADIMARLKEIALNFEEDRSQIAKISERCKAMQSYKVFLEAHMEIKAVVVRLSGNSALGKDDLWPMDVVLSKTQPHELRKLYIGVKNMVISFDMLTRTDMELLETEGEVVLNGENLIDLFKHAAKSRHPASLKSHQQA